MSTAYSRPDLSEKGSSRIATYFGLGCYRDDDALADEAYHQLFCQGPVTFYEEGRVYNQCKGLRLEEQYSVSSCR